MKLIAPITIIAFFLLNHFFSGTHNGALRPDAGSYHRSVCIDNLYYNKDGTIKRIIMLPEGIKMSK